MFLYVETSRRGSEKVLVGLANITTIKHREGEALTFKMADGEQITAPGLDMSVDDIAKLLGNRKIMVIDLTGDAHKKKDDGVVPLPVAGTPSDPNLVNQTAASADPNGI